MGNEEARCGCWRAGFRWTQAIDDANVAGNERGTDPESEADMAIPERFSNLPEYAFPRLRALLSGIEPGLPPGTAPINPACSR